MIAFRREETGVLVMELSEHLWHENLELAILAVHDIARSPQNSLLLLVVVDSDFDTPLGDFLCQMLQPGILAQNRPSRVAVLTTNPAEPKNNSNASPDAYCKLSKYLRGLGRNLLPRMFPIQDKGEPASGE